jgi:hypothetical protein
VPDPVSRQEQRAPRKKGWADGVDPIARCFRDDDKAGASVGGALAHRSPNDLTPRRVGSPNERSSVPPASFTRSPGERQRVLTLVLRALAAPSILDTRFGGADGGGSRLDQAALAALRVGVQAPGGGKREVGTRFRAIYPWAPVQPFI